MKSFLLSHMGLEAQRLGLGAGHYRQIARILGIGDHIDWRVGSFDGLPLRDREADIVYCIEVLGHVSRLPEAGPDLCRTTKDLLILTTPNLVSNRCPRYTSALLPLVSDPAPAEICPDL